MMSGTAKTIFGDEVNLLEQTDILFAQLVNILYANADFNTALDKGELTPEATTAIASAFDEVFDRNRRLANIFLADREAREQVTKFWFARAYAEVQASKVYNDAFRRVAKAIGAA
jgi:hypothetical protein